MRRSKRPVRPLSTPAALILLCLASAVAVAADTVWPGPPADPIVRLESVVGKLIHFEVAVQGPVEGKPRTIRKLGRPSGIAFDGRGRLLVSDARQRALLQIDTDLGVVLVFGTGTTPRLRAPQGLVAHPDGTIFVADSGLRQVVAFDAGGRVAAVYGEGELEEPIDVALSPDGSRLYVADGRANSIGIFDLASRRRVDTLGSRGTRVGEFYSPTAVEFDRAGNLLIVDQLNERVQLFDPSGASPRLLDLTGKRGDSRPRDVAAAGSGTLFVTDSARSRIQVYDSALNPLLTFGRNGLGEGEFLEVGGVAVRGDRLAVLDKAGGRVQLFRLYSEPPVSQRHAQSTWREARAEPEPSAPAPRKAPEPAEEPVEEPMAPAAPEPAAETPVVEEPLPAPAAAPEPEDSAEAARVAQQLLELVQAWAAAWSDRDADRYLGFYSESFQPADGSSRRQWAAHRRARVTAPDSIEVGIQVVETKLEEGAAEITFVQSYRSERYADRVLKTLRLVLEAGGWKIERESVLETL